MLVLGAGYVGRAFCVAQGKVAYTHRFGPTAADAISSIGRGYEFRIEDPSTWDDLPRHPHILWTFPAATSEEQVGLAVEFFEKHCTHARTLVLGSTSAYVPASPHGWVSETSPLDLSQGRVRAEEALREKGATIIQLAGIFGPGREPGAWLRKGLIKNGASFVNLVHLEDIVLLLARIFQLDVRGERINLANGKPRRWYDIVAVLQARGELPQGFKLPQEEPAEGSKRVSIEKLRSLVGDDICGGLRDCL